MYTGGTYEDVPVEVGDNEAVRVDDCDAVLACVTPRVPLEVDDFVDEKDCEKELAHHITAAYTATLRL